MLSALLETVAAAHDDRKSSAADEERSLLRALTLLSKTLLHHLQAPLARQRRHSDAILTPF